MTRIQRFKFLQIFGDGNPHNWFEVIFLGVKFLKIHQTQFEAIFKKALADGLIRRVADAKAQQVALDMAEHEDGIFVGLDWRQYHYVVTPSGDECLRNEQIARHGDISYYMYYDRTLNGSNGLQKYAPIPKGFKPV